MMRFTQLILKLLASWLVCGGLVACAAEDPLPPQKPLLWKVTAPDGTLKGYVFGTIHLGDPRVAKIQPVVRDAVKSSNVLVTEIHMDADASAKAAAASMLPADEKRNLADFLPDETEAKLDAELKRIFPMFSVQAPPFNRMQVWSVMVTVPILEPMLEYPGAPGVDERLVQIAKKHQMELDALETVDEQLGALSDYPVDDLVKMLDLTLDGMAKSRELDQGNQTEKMILSYRKGDLEALAASSDWNEELYGVPEPVFVKQFMKALVDDRNVRMVERTLERYQKRPEDVFFVAVGALHLPGETGLIQGLERGGYLVERVAVGKLEAAAAN
ncbi:TraB/GumN family protein [Sulfuriroseicoccus oceanibius]|uniref:TraB/GumN family protein n=1 Tax=Sulfuriroseicoccus oceanibius TaxID=2707525 RepID=A0A6B3L8E7_9BACT|nr:TraB/GumN family protein [Sulfuriroseicoccus oceanibius]QQL45001.1 TraB/GumN family protein [Sulfuriroseicoccus oceanibius]